MPRRGDFQPRTLFHQISAFVSLFALLAIATLLIARPIPPLSMPFFAALMVVSIEPAEPLKQRSFPQSSVQAYQQSGPDPQSRVTRHNGLM